MHGAADVGEFRARPAVGQAVFQRDDGNRVSLRGEVPDDLKRADANRRRHVGQDVQYPQRRIFVASVSHAPQCTPRAGAGKAGVGAGVFVGSETLAAADAEDGVASRSA